MTDFASMPVYRSPFDSGRNDAYYGRTPWGPNYWVKGPDHNIRVPASAMTAEQIAEYKRGVASEDDLKDWGV